MTPVEIQAIQGSLILRARGSELLILPHHVSALKSLKQPTDFTSYFLQDALINRPARKLFEAWLRKDGDLWKRIYRTIQKEMADVEEQAPTPVATKSEKTVVSAPASEKTKSKEKKVEAETPKAKETAKKAAAPKAKAEEKEKAAAPAKKAAAPAAKKVTKAAAKEAPKKKTAAAAKTAKAKPATKAAAKPAAKKKTATKAKSRSK
ncbi:MAG: hypothetical protein AB7T49_00045 [Oligoflexales bacterium]